MAPAPTPPVVMAAEAPAVPQFPWPPPAASASIEIERQLLVNPSGTTLLGNVNDRLVAAFNKAGYGEKSFYAVPDGYVLVSRLEQIKPDGTSWDESARWSTDLPPLGNFTMATYLRALFTAQTGHYRVVCFVVCPHPFPESQQRVTDAEAVGWLSHGLNTLPSEIGAATYTADFHCMALIYEFAKTPGDEPTLALPPGSLSAEMHLRGTGIPAALAAMQTH